MKSFYPKLHVLSRLSSIEYSIKSNPEKPKVEKRKRLFSCLPLFLPKKRAFFGKYINITKKNKLITFFFE